MERRIKLVVVGDSYVGKTSLLHAYTQKKFVGEYATTVYDNWAVNVKIEQRSYTLNLFDTAGQEDLAHLRTLSYPQSNVFLLCFSFVDPKSLENCILLWMPEIRQYAGDQVPVILVGTKQDLTEKAAVERTVSLEDAHRAALKMGVAKFIPCSSLTHLGLKQVFDDALLCAIGEPIQAQEEERPCCFIL